MTTVSMQKINQDLVDLWASYNHLNHALAPMQYPNGEEGAILFVGINPSFSAKGWNTVLNKAGKPTINGIMFNNAKDVEKYLQWPSSNLPPSYPATPCLESLAHQHYSQFYSWHEKLSTHLRTHWFHADLFAFRETKQKGKKYLSCDTSGCKGCGKCQNCFNHAQFQIFLKIVDAIKPCTIIVCNALASRIYFDRCINRHITPNQSTGYFEHQISTETKQKIPLFFSGMLTGGRATDIDSRNRLFWNVTQALKNNGQSVNYWDLTDAKP